MSFAIEIIAFQALEKMPELLEEGEEFVVRIFKKD